MALFCFPCTSFIRLLKLPAISKVKATRTALAEYPGKVTSTRVETLNGEPVYIFSIVAPNQPVQLVRVEWRFGQDHLSGEPGNRGPGPSLVYRNE